MNDGQLLTQPVTGVPRNTYELIARAARNAPNHDTLLFLPDAESGTEPVRLTAAQFLVRVTRAANAFRRLGVRPDDVISVLLPNVLQAQLAFWGAEAAGIVNPINFLLSPEHIADVMKAAGSRILVALGPHPAIDIWQKAQAVRALVPGIEQVIAVSAEAVDGAPLFDALLAAEGDAPLDGVGDRQPGDVAAFFHTGGTTGAPKLVQHTHANQVHAALATAEAMDFDADDTVICGLPMFHVAGPMLLSLAPLAAGATILMPTPSGYRNPLVLKHYWEIVDRCGVTIFGGVPTSLTDILNSSGPAPSWPERRMACLTGGAQLGEALHRRFSDETGYPVHQIYGMTETAGVIACAPRGEVPRYGSAGKAVKGVEVRIVRSGGTPANDQCADGEPGAIFVRGPNVSAGYSNRVSGLTSLTDEDGWLETGDLGHCDADGWIFITGRAKDVIIRSAHNIDPVTIEEVAARHPSILQAVAVGRPDPRAGEVPVLFVKLREGCSESPEAIRSFVVDNIPEAPAKPAAVFITSQIPMTAVGKIFRPALRHQAIVMLVKDKLDELLGEGHGTEVEVDPHGAHLTRLLIAFGDAPPRDATARLEDWLAMHNLEYRAV